jgi:hypothetical protein
MVLGAAHGSDHDALQRAPSSGIYYCTGSEDFGHKKNTRAKVLMISLQEYFRKV